MSALCQRSITELYIENEVRSVPGHQPGSANSTQASIYRLEKVNQHFRIASSFSYLAGITLKHNDANSIRRSASIPS